MSIEYSFYVNALRQLNHGGFISDLEYSRIMRAIENRYAHRAPQQMRCSGPDCNIDIHDLGDK